MLLSQDFLALLSFIKICHGGYDPDSKSNMVLYYGQGYGQGRLLHFCQQSTVDIIPLAFVNIFPAQGNGYPGTNFANQCWGGTYVYVGPGNNATLNQLQSSCPDLVADISVCQSTYGKKILLSLGGGTETYQLSHALHGRQFADFLWGAFGPQTSSWLSDGLPRPFDGPDGLEVTVDGFDFDIEVRPTDGSAGYIAMIDRLHWNFQFASKQYLITGAPQCVVPDANMGAMIAATKFDLIFVQFYNTPQCSARAFINSYPYDDVSSDNPFTYESWANFLIGTASENATLYLGLPGAHSTSKEDQDGNEIDYYLNSTEIGTLIGAYYCDDSFGGVMIWEATSADKNDHGPYYDMVKNVLEGYDNDASYCGWQQSQPLNGLYQPSLNQDTNSLEPKL